MVSVLGDSIALQADIFAAVGAALFILFLVPLIIMLAAMWKVFSKAGQPGWAAIIPIYNIYILLQIVGRPVWWLILVFIPIANFVVMIILTLDLSKAFGKGVGFAIGMILVPIIFWPILGFGGSQYQGAPN